MTEARPSPLAADELAELPVFPLPRAVFFPGTTMGLHLFEPRYREMARHCLERGPAAMAVAQLVPGHESEYEGQPPIFEVAGAGRIVAHRVNPDGTFDLVLACVARVRLHELPFVAPFRRARAEVLLDVVGRRGDTPSGEAVDAVVDRLVRDPLARQQFLETLDVDQRRDELERRLRADPDPAARWRRAN